MLYIVPLRGRFGGLLSAAVLFGGVEGTCDGFSFCSMPASSPIGVVRSLTSTSLLVCHLVRLGIYIRSDFPLWRFADCVNWLVVVWTWWNGEP